MADMTAVRRAEIRARCAAVHSTEHDDFGHDDCEVCEAHRRAVADLSRHAAADLLDALAQIDRLEALVASLQERDRQQDGALRLLNLHF